MAVLGTIVLLFQALLLAHGGLTTLGANAFSMAIVGPWAGYGAFLLTRRVTGSLLGGVFAGMALADLATYVTTSLQLALAFPDADSGLVGAAVKFLGVFAVTQVPLARTVPNETPKVTGLRQESGPSQGRGSASATARCARPARTSAAAIR